MKPFLTILFIFLSSIFSKIIAQIPAGTIEVRGQLVEQVANQKRGIGNVEILVPPNGRYLTNQNGNFFFKIKYNSDQLNIGIQHREYKIMSPRGGIVELMGEKMVNQKPIIQIEILVVGKHTHPELEEQLHQWERKVKSLERKRKLSQKQINVLSEQIVKNTLSFENEKHQLRTQIDELQKDIKLQTYNSAALQDSLQALRQQNIKLNKRVEELTEDLFDALAEKYLRQQEHYQLLAAQLEDYLIKTKDLRDWLNHMDDYFLHPQAQQDFIHVVGEYEKAWKVLNNNHQSYELKVQQEWNNNFVLENLENTFRFLLNDIHQKTFLGTFQSNVYSPLQAWGTGKIGKRQVKKFVKKGSPIALQDFNAKISQLEKMIESTLFQLRTNL